jgi:hypothetical protein
MHEMLIAGELTGYPPKIGAALWRLEDARSRTLRLLSEMPLEDFHRLRSLPQYDVSPAWVLHHLAQPEAEHRSEMGSAIALLKTGNQAGTPNSSE